LEKGQKLQIWPQKSQTSNPGAGGLESRVAKWKSWIFLWLAG